MQTTSVFKWYQKLAANLIPNLAAIQIPALCSGYLDIGTWVLIGLFSLLVLVCLSTFQR
jgi:hypothetical protein